MFKKFIILVFFIIFNLVLLVYAQDNNSSIKLLFASDVLGDREFKNKVIKNSKGDYYKIFNKINGYLNSFDYFVINLNTPIFSKTKVKSADSFLMDSQTLTTFQEINIKRLNLNNNDKWSNNKVLKDTLRNLNKEDLFFNSNKDSYQSYISFSKDYFSKNFQIKKNSESLLRYNLNGRFLLLKIADEPQEWEQGLMFIKKDDICGGLRKINGCLRSFDGMIFLFPNKQVRYFWNKNTFVDLDVYWLDDNKVIGKSFLPSIEKTKEIITISSNFPVNKVIEIIK